MMTRASIKLWWSKVSAEQKALAAVMILGIAYTLIYQLQGMPYPSPWDEKIATHPSWYHFEGKHAFDFVHDYMYQHLGYYIGSFFLSFHHWMTGEVVDSGEIYRLIRRYLFLSLALSHLAFYFGVRRLFGWQGALFATSFALFSAYYPSIHYYVYYDTYILIFVNLLVLAYGYLTTEPDEHKKILLYYPLATLAIALAASVKISGLMLGVPLALFYAVDTLRAWPNLSQKQRLLRLGAPAFFGLIFLAIFFGVHPHYLSHWQDFVAAAQGQAARYQGEMLGANPDTPLLFYITQLLFYPAGLLGAGVIVWSLVNSSTLPWPARLLFWTSFLFPLLYFGSQKLALDRNIALMVPLFFVLTGAWLNGGKLRTTRMIAGYCLLLHTAAVVIGYTFLPDTRKAVEHYLNSPASAELIADNPTPPIYAEDLAVGYESLPTRPLGPVFHYFTKISPFDYYFTINRGAPPPPMPHFKKDDLYAFGCWISFFVNYRSPGLFNLSPTYLYSEESNETRKTQISYDVLRKFPAHVRLKTFKSVYDSADCQKPIWGLATFSFFDILRADYSGFSIMIDRFTGEPAQPLQRPFLM